MKLVNPNSEKDQKTFLSCLGVFFTRAITLYSDVYGLFAVLDLVNHSFDSNSYHRFDKVDGTMKLIALKDIAIDEEITFSYGDDYDSSRYLSIFGFIPDINKKDHVNFSSSAYSSSSCLPSVKDVMSIIIILPKYVKGRINSSLLPLPDSHPFSGIELLNIHSNYFYEETRVFLHIPMREEIKNNNSKKSLSNTFMRLLATYHNILYHYHKEYNSLNVEKELLLVLKSEKEKEVISLSDIYSVMKKSKDNNKEKWWHDALVKLFKQEIDFLDSLIRECETIIKK